MDESAPPQGSGLLFPVDLTDRSPPSGAELSAPSAKKARLMCRYQQLSSSASASSTTGRPPGIMSLFTISAVKQTSPTTVHFATHALLLDSMSRS